VQFTCNIHLIKFPQLIWIRWNKYSPGRSKPYHKYNNPTSSAVFLMADVRVMQNFEQFSCYIFNSVRSPYLFARGIVRGLFTKKSTLARDKGVKATKTHCFHITIMMHYLKLYLNMGPPWRSRHSNSLRDKRSGARTPFGATFSGPSQNGTEAHPASCTVDAWSFPCVKQLRRWPTTPSSARSSMDRAVLLPALCDRLGLLGS